MDEKLGYRYANFGKPAHATMKPYSRPPRRFRPLLILTLVVLGFYYYVRPLTPFAVVPDIAIIAPKHATPAEKPIVDTSALVPFEAHIMSKCPDAKDCLRMLVLPAMQRVIEKVNFTLSYIGTPTANDGVDCKHGPEECMLSRLSVTKSISGYFTNIWMSSVGLGNIMLLCASNLYPDPKIYLGFAMCLIKDYEDIPQRSLIEDCALEHAIDFDKLSDCASQDDGGFGVDMLRKSVGRSAAVSQPHTNSPADA